MITCPHCDEWVSEHHLCPRAARAGAIAAGIAANKRRAENLTQVNAALDAYPAVTDALLALFNHTAFYEHHYHPNGKRELVALRKAAAIALRAADRLPAPAAGQPKEEGRDG